MVAFLYRMPAGIAGDVTRAEHALIEARQIDSALPPTRFGRFVKSVAGKIQPIASGDAATVVKGLYVRPYPTNSSQDDLGVSTAKTKGTGDVLRRGYMMVQLNQGPSTKDGQVYVRVTANGGKLVGDIEAGADSGACVAVANCFFTGPADANGIVEVEFNI